MPYVLFGLAMLALVFIASGIGYFVINGVLSDFGPLVKVAAVGVLALMCLGISLDVWLQNYHNKHWATCTVKRVTETSGTKRVYTSDCGLLQVRDINWQLNRHSGDTFGDIPDHGKVRLLIVGSRWSARSWKPIVLDAKPVGKN